MALHLVRMGLWAAFGALVLAQACGGSDSEGDTTGSGGSGADSGAGASGGLIIDASGDGAGMGDGCALYSEKAKPRPLDMYIMLDTSGSMTGSLWQNTIGAIAAFVKDPLSDGLGVGLDFFPGDNQCAATTYSTPTVPIALLPGNMPNVVNAFGGITPSGETPTLPAMQGALTYAQAYATQNPDRVVVIVLATDGQPNQCSSTVDAVAAVAKQGVDGSPQIHTFVIGVGPSLTNLNAIAVAGGTEKAFIVNTAGNVSQQLTEALNSIRGGLSCEFLIPIFEAGVANPKMVNVWFKPEVGQEELVPKYADKSKCPATGNGWYYDSELAPTKILLCPSTCSMVKVTAGQVDVVYGCPTSGPA